MLGLTNTLYLLSSYLHQNTIANFVVAHIKNTVLYYIIWVDDKRKVIDSIIIKNKRASHKPYKYIYCLNGSTKNL